MVVMWEIASFIADQPAGMFTNYCSTLEILRERLFEGRVTDLLTCLKKLDDEEMTNFLAALSEPVGEDNLQSDE